MAVDVNALKETMAHWVSGVTIVTATLGAKRVGITANSLTSVSLKPPQILVCINKKLYTHSAIIESGAFAVNILGREHLEWGMRFAGMIPEVEDRFAGIECRVAATGSPILEGALGWLDCRLHHVYDGGDHSVFIGEVLATSTRRDGEPILYYYRQWRRMDDEILTLTGE